MSLVAIGAGSAAGIVVLAGVGWLVVAKRRDPKVGTPEDAAAAAEGALSGFAVAGAVVGADGLGALAVATDGRVAAIKRRGKALAVREVPWTVVRATPEGIVVETGDGFGRVSLAGVNALDIRRLAPKMARI
ncbi:hypothetical protein [Sphingomonas sp.]|uniref:hypothetical protein n=1 Tax=Sphingomonas sp. TaxID=28214 RepID=UPI0035B29AD8